MAENKKDHSELVVEHFNQNGHRSTNMNVIGNTIHKLTTYCTFDPSSVEEK